jgi:tetratricopeptide (TPR) repeat protein
LSRSTCWRTTGWAFLLLSIGVGIAVLGVALSSQWNPARGHLLRAGDRDAAQALVRGQDFLQRGQPRLAIEAVSSVREGAPQESEALTIRGLAFAALEDVGTARMVLEKAWRLRPNAMAAKVLAAIYLGANETDRGLQMLHAAARLVPDDFRPWFAMGDCVFMRRRSYEDAAAAFREALKRSPAHVESRVGLIGALTRAHHLDQAEPLLEAMLRERPYDPSVLIHAAGLAFESDRPQDGARYIEHLLTVDPDHREALLLRARMHLGNHQPREALADAERALALAPNDLETVNLIGSIQTALGLKERAAATIIRRREIERWTALIGEITLQIRQRPADPEPRWRLGDAAALAGMRPLAVQSYQAALALAPNCEHARQGLRKLEDASEAPGRVATQLARPSLRPSR